MDLSTGGLLGVIGLMALNQLVMRIGALESNRWVFYGLQLVNVAAGSFLLVWGLPGFEGLPIISWLVGLLFFFHTVQNTNHRARFLRARAQEERRRKEREIRAALDAHDDA